MTLLTKIQAKLRVKRQYAGNDLRGILGMNKTFFREARGNRILVYHGICPQDPTRFNSLFISLKIFEEHLKFYKEYFNVISLNEYYQAQFSKERFNVCLTFDDGFDNNYKYVLPLLHKFQVPATFFITAVRSAGYDILWNDFLAIVQKYGPPALRVLNEDYYKDRYRRYISKNSGKTLQDILRLQGFENKAAMMRQLEPMIPFKRNESEMDYWLQMTEEEIRQLSGSPLVTLGCHGLYHNDLAALPMETVRDELVKSKQFLEKITEKQMDAIAFPYGSYTRETIHESKSAGFTQLLAADFLLPQDQNDAMMRERLTISPYISVNNQMTAIIHGKYPR